MVFEDNQFINLHLRIESSNFDPGMPLDSVSEYLRGYRAVLYSSSEITAARFSKKKKLKIEPPNIYINTLDHKCIDATFVIDLTTVFATLGPIISQIDFTTYADYTWNLIKGGFEVLTTTADFFSKEGKSPNVIIKNSPGANVLVQSAGRDIIVTPEAWAFANKIGKPLTEMSQRLELDEAHRMKFERLSKSNDVEVLDYDDSTSRYLRILTSEAQDQKPIELDARIYDLNVRSRSGRLELEDLHDGEVRSLPFSIPESESIDKYIDALRHSHSRVLAKRLYTANSLGEIKIKHLLVVDIEPHV